MVLVHQKNIIILLRVRVYCCCAGRTRNESSTEPVEMRCASYGKSSVTAVLPLPCTAAAAAVVRCTCGDLFVVRASGHSHYNTNHRHNSSRVTVIVAMVMLYCTAAVYYCD